jgi:hypothetical protein
MSVMKFRLSSCYQGIKGLKALISLYCFSSFFAPTTDDVAEHLRGSIASPQLSEKVANHLQENDKDKPLPSLTPSPTPLGQL